MVFEVVIIFSQVKSDVVITKELKEKIEKMKREDKVKFAIGMIVSYWEYGKNHCGVIIGWNYKSNQYFKKEFIENQEEMSTIIYFTDDISLSTPINTNIKPYYIILSENHGICYVEQGIKICIIFINMVMNMILYLSNVYLSF